MAMGLLTGRLRDWRLDMVAPYLRGHVLDLGCGDGELLRRFADRFETYTGVERSPRIVESLGYRFPRHRFVQRDLDSDDLGVEETFDVVLAVAVIEHVYNQRHFLELATQALKPGGNLVLTTPTPFGNDLVHRTGAALGLFSRDAADDHVVIYNRSRFGIVARDFGLRIERYRRFQFGCNQLVVFACEPRPA